MADPITAALAWVGAEIGGTIGANLIMYSTQIAAATAFVATVAGSNAMQRRAQAKARAAYNAGLKDREVTIRSAIAPRRVVYGRDRISGPIVYALSAGDLQQHLHLVVALAAHECDAIETIYFNDVALPAADGSGDILSGDFSRNIVAALTASGASNGSGVFTLPAAASSVVSVSLPVTESSGGGSVSGWSHTPGDSTITGLPASTDLDVAYETTTASPVVRVRSFLGGSGQTADADLVAASGGAWTSAHVGAGICYLYVRLTYDPDVFGQVGVPNISAVVRGKKVYDPRTTTTVWTDNAALIVADWLRDGRYGLRAEADEVPDAEVIAAANICDESVAIDASTNQARYTFGGSFTSDMAPRDVLEDLLTGMAGHCVWTQGRWLLRPGAYRTPDPGAVITADHLAGRGVTVQPRPSRSALFNAVRATYRDPDQGWAEVQAPLVTNATYQTQDGGVQIVRAIQLPGVMDAMRAQRLAKIELERARQAVTLQCTTSLRGYDLAPTDTCTVTLERYGWGTGKVFEVVDRAYAAMDGAVAYSMRETAATVYAWAYGEATAVDPAPDTDLPSPYARPAEPASLAAASGTTHLLALSDGTLMTRAYVTWTQSAEAFVTAGGRVELRWRRQADADWQAMPPAAGDAVAAYIDNLPDAQVVLIGARFVNGVGRASHWATIGHYVVGKTALPAAVADLTATAQPGGVGVTWTASAEADYAETEIRHGASWAAGTVIYRGRGTSVAWAWPAAGGYTLRAKHRDTTGNESGEATLAVTVGSGSLIGTVNILPGSAAVVYDYAIEAGPISRSNIL